ncbi:MAG TPA: 2Fe-2S iron-sulfur cluster-binding protein [Mycobacteriales bacterium]|jgi:aerobic-type carbon monoxide dehydrogenase small subunit (CoxS/CutS family)|nr:2Fe-2S iron-sulfur cluster-binding protein [Mycobacteriales bacterium]
MDEYGERSEPGPHGEEVAFSCVVNGVETVLTGAPAAPASLALRAEGLFSVRETCGLGVCGTCTVLLDGEPVSTCILPLYAVEGRSVQTAEGLESDGRLSALQEEFIAKQAFQCSFCTPGFLMSGQALLASADGELSDQAIVDGLQGHLCRCGCYASIKEAVSACAGRAACHRAG